MARLCAGLNAGAPVALEDAVVSADAGGRGIAGPLRWGVNSVGGLAAAWVAACLHAPMAGIRMLGRPEKKSVTLWAAYWFAGPGMAARRFRQRSVNPFEIYCLF